MQKNQTEHVIMTGHDQPLVNRRLMHLCIVGNRCDAGRMWIVAYCTLLNLNLIDDGLESTKACERPYPSNVGRVVP